MSIDIPKTRLYGLGEVSPYDDYSNPQSSGKKEVFKGYSNDLPGRTKKDIEKWAVDTDELAKYSIRTHLIEAILKVPSYFLMQSDFDNSWIGKIIFTSEKITGAFGDMFRNEIYGHRDKNGNFDDNVGAEEFTHSGKDTNSKIPSLGLVNNQLQTKGRFIVSALGLINPEFANDLDWAFIKLFNSMWWRNMSNNIAYGPNFSSKVYKTIFGSLFNKQENTVENDENRISWEYVKNKFHEHTSEVSNWWKEFNKTKKSDTEKRKECLINISQSVDKTVSCFTPVINWLNIFGDLARPIARRLDLQGFSRTTIRTLSVIGKPLTWANNIFRFYLPEKLTENNRDKNKLFPFVTLPDLLLTSTIADMFDFGFTVGENRLNESSGNLQHLIEIGRRLKNSAQDIYFAARRRKPLEYLQEGKSDQANSKISN